MLSESLTQLRQLINRLIIFVGRPQVRMQLIALALVILLALIISFVIWRLIGPPLNRVIKARLQGRTRAVAKFLALLLKGITVPILALVFSGYARNVLQARGQLTGLLVELEQVFYTILAFEILIAILYSNLSPEQIRRYHYRLIRPLFYVILFLQILNHFINLGDLASIVLLELFDSPITIRALFIATLGFYFWVGLVSAMHTFIQNLIVKHTAIDKGSSEAILTILHYTLIALGFFYVISQLNLDSTTVAAIMGGLSVGIGFSLREVLSNFISGIYLLFERSLQPGDVISVDGEMGVVKDLSIRATTVSTLNNIELVIPNQTFFTSSFKTFTGTNKADRKVRFAVGVRTSCENDMRQVLSLLKETALKHPEILKEPAPDVWVQESFGDNVVDYRLMLWIESPVRINPVKSEVIQLVWNAFLEHDIGLTFPDLELHFNPSLQKSLQTNLLDQKTTTN